MKKVPVPQGLLGSRKIRFTVAFGTTITIVARRRLAVSRLRRSRRPAAVSERGQALSLPSCRRAGRISDVGHKKAGAIPGGLNEGVGEHVRTRYQPLGQEAPGVKLRNASVPQRTKKDRFFCRTDLEDRKLGPTVDLMSRRHPLSSSRAPGGSTGFRQFFA